MLPLTSHKIHWNQMKMYYIGSKFKMKLSISSFFMTKATSLSKSISGMSFRLHSFMTALTVPAPIPLSFAIWSLEVPRSLCLMTCCLMEFGIFSLPLFFF